MDTDAILARRADERMELLATVERELASLTQRTRPDAVVVFGSVARGDFNRWSDIDVLVVSDHLPDDRDARAELLRMPPRVQVVAWSTSEWAARLAARDAITIDAVEHGVWLRGSPTALSG